MPSPTQPSNRLNSGRPSAGRLVKSNASDGTIGVLREPTVSSASRPRMDLFGASPAAHPQLRLVKRMLGRTKTRGSLRKRRLPAPAGTGVGDAGAWPCSSSTKVLALVSRQKRGRDVGQKKNQSCRLPAAPNAVSRFRRGRNTSRCARLAGVSKPRMPLSRKRKKNASSRLPTPLESRCAQPPRRSERR